MVGKPIDIRSLTLEELSGVISVYPWFSAARMELCSRMSRMGDVWTEEQYAANALYLPSREAVAELASRRSDADFSDNEVQEYVHQASETPQKQVFVVGGDYFSLSQYEKVRRAEDSIFPKFAVTSDAGSAAVENQESAFHSDFCTETLAQVYVGQGYPEQAREIYSKLSLRYPEKSAYFAGLIAKIEENI